MHQPIAGSVDAIAHLREAGHRVLFVTNNSFSTVADQEQALEKIGVSAKGEVCTSSQAAGLLLSPKDRVLLGGGPGVMEAIIRQQRHQYQCLDLCFHRQIGQQEWRPIR